MIIDSSALLSILLREDDGDLYLDRIADAATRRMSSATWFEASMVAEGRKGPEVGARFDEIIRRMGIEVVAFTAEHGELARAAWRRYGRGNNAASSLNFGDCMSYALAKATNEPLLFKGRDFGATDITPALKT